MTKYRRDLICQLFALATAALEDLHIRVSRGQSPRLRPRDYHNAGRELGRAAKNLAAIAATIEIATRDEKIPRIRSRTTSTKRRRS